MSELDEILTIFRSELGIDGVDLDDSFFDLGGDSLMAERLVMGLNKRFQTDFATAILLNASTPSELENAVSDQKVRKTHRDVVLELPRCSGTVQAVMIHGMSGSALYANRFGSGFRERCQISVIRGLGLAEGEEPAKTAREFADSYVAGVKATRGTYPEVFGGICVGGLVAMEMAEGYFRRFHRRPRIILIDPPPLGSAWLKPTKETSMADERTAALTRKVRFWRKIRDTMEAKNLGTTALGRKARRTCFKKSLTRAFSGHVPTPFPCSILLIASSEWEGATIDLYREWLPTGSDIHSVIIKSPHKGFHRTNPELIDQRISSFLDNTKLHQQSI